MTEEEKIRKIESFGDLYCREQLSYWDKEDLESNWWESLKFFFGHSFFRGRRDELSNEYRYFTIAILTDYFSIKDKSLDESYQKLKDSRLGPILRFWGHSQRAGFWCQRQPARENRAEGSGRIRFIVILWQLSLLGEGMECKDSCIVAMLSRIY